MTSVKSSPFGSAGLLILAVTVVSPGVLYGNQFTENVMKKTTSSALSDPAGSDEQSSRHTNRLASETSPYLLQHAHNPVDWYPWGEEAFRRASDEKKPIFLSIGYSACHWCHVMERESFEDPATAEILNAHFISIKVDREERPDVDEIYMTAVQMSTGSGGWPLTVFLTPDLKPFFGGTYFPPDSRYGRPGFKDLLRQIAKLWDEQADGLMQDAERLTGALRSHIEATPSPSNGFNADVMFGAVAQLQRSFDAEWGGFGNAPKFPPSGAISVLLRQHARTVDERLLEMATVTLDRMACGGLYDQIGGGFHRYSTDARWLVPHFEKMLYDNALLARAYLEGWQVTHDDLYRRIATETLDYVLRDMTDSRGAFHSSEDADSEGEEGKFYVWRPEEIRAVLGEEDGNRFCEHFGVTERGNFEGHSILNIAPERTDTSAVSGTPDRDFVELRAKLRLAREQRIRPAMDYKILAAWNGMMISALARGYQSLGEDRFLKAAEDAADFVMTEMFRDGVLMRVHRTGAANSGNGTRPAPGYLDDYAEMANGLVDLYEATFDMRWLDAASDLADIMVSEFWDESEGGFFYTSPAHTNLLVRTKPYYDGATPSGNSTAAITLFRLAKLLDNDSYRVRAEAVLNSAGNGLRTHPQGYLNMLCAVDFHLGPVREFALVGDLESSDTRQMLSSIQEMFIPNKVVALAEPDVAGADAPASPLPLLRNRPMVGGGATVYVCEDYACKQPVTDVDSLREALRDLNPGRPLSAGPQSGLRAGESR